MKGTGVFVTEEERQRVETARRCSGMSVSGGQVMGDPSAEVSFLMRKYSVPHDVAFGLRTGEFVYPLK